MRKPGRYVNDAQLVLPCAIPAAPQPRPNVEGIALPLADKLAIDLKRVMSILSCDKNLANRLVRCKHLAAYRIGKVWVVEYQSVVDLCDSLRLKYCIRDRRAKKQHNGRWRDDELLPFPMSDTISVETVAAALGRSNYTVTKLVEAGTFEAYRLPLERPWRISNTSFEAYAEKLRSQFESSRQEARQNLRMAL